GVLEEPAEPVAVPGRPRVQPVPRTEQSPPAGAGGAAPSARVRCLVVAGLSLLRHRTIDVPSHPRSQDGLMSERSYSDSLIQCAGCPFTLPSPPVGASFRCPVCAFVWNRADVRPYRAISDRREESNSSAGTSLIDNERDVR